MLGYFSLKYYNQNFGFHFYYYCWYDRSPSGLFLYVTPKIIFLIFYRIIKEVL
jgi:hypothetical protein